MLQPVHSQVLQDVAKRLNKAFHAFFRRVKNGETPGYPRFKSFGRYHSFTYPQGGYALRDARLHLSKIGDVQIKLHRPIEGAIKPCTIVVKNGCYYVVFSGEVEAVPLPETDAMVGVARSTFTPLPAPSVYRQLWCRTGHRLRTRRDTSYHLWPPQTIQDCGSHFFVVNRHGHPGNDHTALWTGHGDPERSVSRSRSRQRIGNRVVREPK